jgi:hypothetical protein
MPENSGEEVTQILVPIVIQDLSVLAAEGWGGATTHPSGARCASGFFDGPACKRVAIVDIDATSGTLRPPARVLTPDQVRMYQNTGSYEAQPPYAGGRRELWLRNIRDRSELGRLEQADYVDDPFMKVSAFGTVIRTLGFLESPVGLARLTDWAFKGEQLLVVPAAGERENAFYDRDSGSLRFFYFDTGGENDVRVYTALSQDVVVHEAAHAVIDSVAPDLYHASTTDSLAIHEAVADITAALVSVLNRGCYGGGLGKYAERFMDELRRSNRHSRFAEQFGAKARGSETLRDLKNDRRLGGAASDRNVVDIASPHSLSEVLSGALFSVLRRSVVEADKYGPLPPFPSRARGSRSGLAVATAARMASLALKGLDWLPPGDVSLADYGRAVLAADRFHLPDSAGQRDLFVAELERRGVARAGDLDTSADVAPLGPIDFESLSIKRGKARAFVHKHRELFGIPAGVRFDRPRVRMHRTRDRAIRGWCRSDTMANLDRPIAPVTAERAELLVIQVAWWTAEPNSLGRAFGMTREVKRGATLAVDADGVVHALLRGGQEPELIHRRDAFLARQARAGHLLAPHQGVGPDGAKLTHYLYAEQHQGGTRFTGGLRALHLLEEPP